MIYAVNECLLGAGTYAEGDDIFKTSNKKEALKHAHSYCRELKNNLTNRKWDDQYAFWVKHIAVTVLSFKDEEDDCPEELFYKVFDKVNFK